MKFYGFEYKIGEATTTGHPNEKTGSYSIAGDLRVFKSKKERENWVYGSHKRISLTLKDVRKLHLGMSIEYYNEMLSFLDFE